MVKCMVIGHSGMKMVRQIEKNHICWTKKMENGLITMIREIKKNQKDI